MKKSKNLMTLIAVMAMSVMVGCSEKKGDLNHMHDSSEHSMEPIQVELSWSPAQASVHEKIIFEAKVTQGGEPVDDAKAVMFEIVNAAKEEDKQELEGKPSGKGTYTAEGSFGEAGSYEVTSHVTARTQHSMPTRTLTVQPE